MNRNPQRPVTLGILGVLTLAVLPGCFSLGRTSPPLEEYVIGGASPTGTVAAIGALDGLAVGIRRLDLADYLASPAIVVRRGSHEVLTSDYHRWGEDLADGINRSVARHLAAAGSFRAVDVAPWPVRSSHDYLIQLHIARFEGVVPAGMPTAGGEAGGAGGRASGAPLAGAEGAAHVRVSWEIIRQQDGAVLVRGATEHREEGWVVGDYAALVALLDQGVVVLARDLAVAMGALAAGGPGEAGGAGR
jgi:uncharacterized protein